MSDAFAAGKVEVSSRDAWTLGDEAGGGFDAIHGVYALLGSGEKIASRGTPMGWASCLILASGRRGAEAAGRACPAAAAWRSDGAPRWA